MMWILGTMAPKSRNSEIQALQTQLRDESLDTLVAPKTSRSIEDFGVQPDVGIEQPHT